MRDTVENVSQLQKQLNELQLENQILKTILDHAGISYQDELAHIKNPDAVEGYDEDQGGRVVHPETITDKMASWFYSRFWSRQDIYAKRSVKKATGEASYFTQCYNFWQENCPKKKKIKISCKDCEYQAYKRLEKKDILAHLRGDSYNASDVIGVYPLLPNGTCRFLVYDFDNHEKGAEKEDFANNDDSWIEEVEAIRRICEINGIDPLVERSRSGRGAHVRIFFDAPIDASIVRKFGFALLDKGAEYVNLKSFQYYDRMLPAQDALPESGVGNLIALPLQGKALREGNSAFVDRNWNAYPDQWKILLSKPRLSLEFIQAKIKEWADRFSEEIQVENNEEREKPWGKERKFRQTDVDGKMEITLSNGIYVDKLNLKPYIQNRIRRMAAVINPVYFKNQAIGTSNYNTPRWNYLGKDHLSGYIEIPRGLYGQLEAKLKEADIPYEVTDERQAGRQIDVTFKGELKEEQTPALCEMIKHDNGILHAATSFGKTVVCSAIIAEKKVNTLVILESSVLMDQWYQSLKEFLTVNEEPPEYKTKTGRIKTRKSVIGMLQGAQDFMTGIIDIAMVGSLCKKGEYHPLLDQYGMVIVDECHHAASETMTAVLQEVKAKYVYGVTATPKRGDRLEKINFMLLGDVRYRYTAKEKAAAQGIDHLVYPRFTRTILPRGMTGKIKPNEAYEVLRNHPVRDEQILDDVKECLKNGRTPVILSKYKDHSLRLYEAIKEYADRAFLLTGDNSKREHKHILEQLKTVEKSESLVLVATGGLVGEGFNYPRLDTLIMATPVSGSQVVEQYAGRLNRDYDGKKNVIIYDYVDSYISMFDNMYGKRLKAYKQIGYDVCTGIRGERQDADTIFDCENYGPVYQRVLLEAAETIVISSPVISGQKVSELIRLLRDRQREGVSVTIVTWDSDSYGFGDSGYWTELHEEIRQAGFHIKSVEESCERFAVIDQRIVWYGGINLLGKDSAEDGMMRVESPKAAAELMEMAFSYTGENRKIC